MSIVVTGATGALGRLVIEELLKRTAPDEIVAVARDRAKAAGLAARGVGVEVADYSRPETLQGVFASGDRVLFISGNEAGRRLTQHRAVIDAAREAGVALLAYTSVLGGPAATFSIAEEHVATEQALLASGVPYCLLRNGWYHENYTGALATTLRTGAVVGSAGQGRVATAARRDYAEAAAVVLTGSGHENSVYELSGDTAWTMAEYAAEVSRQTGRTIPYRDLPQERYVALMVEAGVPALGAQMVADADAGIARGELAATPGELAGLLGRPTTPLAEAITEALKELPA
ncbi:SDR family oxidoreductase [Streptomyces decoyicus]|uniref:SDR family oxidoreductase n=1 Tax=Streptomyces decoyicus TaxID=249567 RepID=UPI0004A9E241|nr:SDR family oxidoreductase [Streptomyces decoyicus]KOG49803.1 quinone oxidoreductase [Streptomyces decoyicus]QZY16722.1 SDR family oxidoreductase [Streptomyces decoyicus]